MVVDRAPTESAPPMTWRSGLDQTPPHCPACILSDTGGTGQLRLLASPTYHRVAHHRLAAFCSCLPTCHRVATMSLRPPRRPRAVLCTSADPSVMPHTSLIRSEATAPFLAMPLAHANVGRRQRRRWPPTSSVERPIAGRPAAMWVSDHRARCRVRTCNHRGGWNM